jgi:hypothetical protein
MCIREEEKESAWPELRARKKRDAADDCLQSLGDLRARKWKGKREASTIRRRGGTRLKEERGGGNGVKPTCCSLHLL